MKANFSLLVCSIFFLCLAASTHCEQAVHLSNPQNYHLELVFRAANLQAQIPTAELHVWMAEPVAGTGQSNIRRITCDPAPTETFIDPEHGNHILYFNLTPSLVEGATIEIRRKYDRTGWNVAFNRGEIEDLGRYDRSTESFQLYTRSERWLEQTDEIQNLSNQLVQGATDDWEKVRRIFCWIRANCTYEYPPPTGRGCLKMLECRKGDCGQYACLFISLARSAGIPARFVAGLPFNEETGTVGHHAWAEVWFPNTGWIPVDPTRSLDRLGTLTPNDIVMSRGPNIPIPCVPEWADYENSEVTAGKAGQPGRTEFIQNACVADRGIDADYSTERRVTKLIYWDRIDTDCQPDSKEIQEQRD